MFEQILSYTDSNELLDAFIFFEKILKQPVNQSITQSRDELLINQYLHRK